MFHFIQGFWAFLPLFLTLSTGGRFFRQKTLFSGMTAVKHMQWKNKVRGRTVLQRGLEDQGFRLLACLTAKWIPFPKNFFAQMEQRVFAREKSFVGLTTSLLVFPMPLV